LYQVEEGEGHNEVESPVEPGGDADTLTTEPERIDLGKGCISIWGKCKIVHLGIHDPWHRTKPRLKAYQVKAETNQDHQRILCRAVLGNKCLGIWTA
jgi:hypothetical protein